MKTKTDSLNSFKQQTDAKIAPNADQEKPNQLLNQPQNDKRQNNGFPKSYRLLTPAQFKVVFDKTERKIHASHLMAFTISNQLPHPRIGLAITKKKVPTAVARNQIKRITRERFRLLADKLPNKDIVIIVKKPIKELSKIELTEQINQIFSKITKNESTNQAPTRKNAKKDHNNQSNKTKQ